MLFLFVPWMDEELKKEKVKVQQRGLEEARGEKTLEKSYPRGKEKNGENEEIRKTQRCRNENRPRQVNTVTRKSKQERKTIPLRLVCRKARAFARRKNTRVAENHKGFREGMNSRRECEEMNETVTRARVFKSYNVNSRSANDAHPQPWDRATCRRIKRQLETQRAPSADRAIEPPVTRLEHDLSRSENVTSSEHSKVRHISGIENVTSVDQRMTRHQNATWTIGQGLSLFAENKLSAQDWGACGPSRGVDQMSKSKSTHGGTARGPQRRERKSTG